MGGCTGKEAEESVLAVLISEREPSALLSLMAVLLLYLCMCAAVSASAPGLSTSLLRLTFTNPTALSTLVRAVTLLLPLRLDALAMIGTTVVDKAHFLRNIALVLLYSTTSV